LNLFYCNHTAIATSERADRFVLAARSVCELPAYVVAGFVFLDLVVLDIRQPEFRIAYVSRDKGDRWQSVWSAWC
jgi:hypothetical protein